MITLTPKQEEVLLIVSEQEGRDPSQMLSLLMDNGVDFWYCDRETLFESKRGTITDTSGTGLWKEAQDFHKREYNGFMQPLSDEAYTALIKEWNKPTEDELPEYEDHPSEYYDKLLNE